MLVHIRMLDKNAQLQQEAVGGARAHAAAAHASPSWPHTCAPAHGGLRSLLSFRAATLFRHLDQTCERECLLGKWVAKI